MLRVALLLIFGLLLARAVRQFLSGVVDGANGPARRSGPPARGVQMVRDPVCGTFVVPSRAVALGDVYFCSERCRDRYRERSA
jgi:YHS domain-containing protein